MTENSELEMYVAGLVLDPVSNAPIVVLKEAEGEACLPIWIGLSEATAIATALKKVPTSRPMTHDLLKNVIDEIGAKVNRIVVRDLVENTFLASIEVIVGEIGKSIDSRPSDAIALAVRTSAPIFVARRVLEQAQVTVVPLPQQAEGQTYVEDKVVLSAAEQEDTNFASIDREKWADILAEMDPDDFKYKM